MTVEEQQELLRAIAHASFAIDIQHEDLENISHGGGYRCAQEARAYVKDCIKAIPKDIFGDFQQEARNRADGIEPFFDEAEQKFDEAEQKGC